MIEKVSKSAVEYFVNEILETSINTDVKMLLSKFSSIVSENLLKCEVMYGIEELRLGTNGANWSIVSGGDQAELNSVFQNKGIHHFFNDEKFDGRVLKYWIPINNSEYEIERDSPRKLSKFYKIGEHNVCMY